MQRILKFIEETEDRTILKAEDVDRIFDLYSDKIESIHINRVSKDRMVEPVKERFYELLDKADTIDLWNISDSYYFGVHANGRLYVREYCEEEDETEEDEEKLYEQNNRKDVIELSERNIQSVSGFGRSYQKEFECVEGSGVIFEKNTDKVYGSYFCGKPIKYITETQKNKLKEDGIDCSNVDIILQQTEDAIMKTRDYTYQQLKSKPIDCPQPEVFAYCSTESYNIRNREFIREFWNWIEEDGIERYNNCYKKKESRQRFPIVNIEYVKEHFPNLELYQLTSGRDYKRMNWTLNNSLSLPLPQTLENVLAEKYEFYRDELINMFLEKGYSASRAEAHCGEWNFIRVRRDFINKYKVKRDNM